MPRTLEESLDPGELRAVIGHELAHHRRGDLLWAWVRLTACTIWWWHPAVWMVSKALRHVQEELCDDEVIRAGVIERDAYCDVLLRAAAIGAPLGVGAAFGDRRHPLADRSKRLLTGQGSARVRPLVARATTVALACALLPGVRHEAVKADRASVAVPVAPVSSPALRVTPMDSSEAPGQTGAAEAIEPSLARLRTSPTLRTSPRARSRTSPTACSTRSRPRSNRSSIRGRSKSERLVAAEIRAHLPCPERATARQCGASRRASTSAEHVVASSDDDEPPLRQFVRGFRNGLRSDDAQLLAKRRPRHRTVVEAD